MNTLPMIPETKARLEAIAKTLKSETLFPKKVEEARLMLKGVKSLPI